MDVEEIECEDVDWIDLAQGRNWWWAFVNTVMNLLVSVTYWNFLGS
jgi:hypothetical protein